MVIATVDRDWLAERAIEAASRWSARRARARDVLSFVRTFDSLASLDISRAICCCSCVACVPRLRWNELSATLVADDVDAFVVALGDGESESVATAPTNAPNAAVVVHR